MKDFGYIEAVFKKEDVLAFRALVKKICKQEDFYYSDIVDYIKGDVSSSLHLTLFYGLISHKTNKQALKKYLQGIKLKTLKLDKLVLMPGYKNLYQVLCVEVLDIDNKLKKLGDNFKQYSFDKSVQHTDFKPHLALAYVKPDFKLNCTPLFPKEIRIKKIKYFEK